MITYICGIYDCVCRRSGTVRLCICIRIVWLTAENRWEKKVAWYSRESVTSSANANLWIKFAHLCECACSQRLIALLWQFLQILVGKIGYFFARKFPVSIEWRGWNVMSLRVFSSMDSDNCRQGCSGCTFQCVCRCIIWNLFSRQYIESILTTFCQRCFNTKNLTCLHPSDKF